MKRLPLILGMLFITVTVRRVAHFAGADALAWTFAIALALSVYISAYLTGWKTTRIAAVISLAFFAIADGFFNMAEVLKWSVEGGRWDQSVTLWGNQAIYMYRFSDVLYGAFPTLAAGVLGWLARYSEKLLAQKRGGFLRRSLDSLESWLYAEESQVITGQSQLLELPEPAQEQFECGQCRRSFGTMPALNAHRRWCQASTNGKEPAIEQKEKSQ